jgi:hypothetical protein
MKKLAKWLQEHTFEANLLALLLMAVPPVLLYFAARQGALGWIYALLGLVVLGNILVLFLR